MNLIKESIRDGVFISETLLGRVFMEGKTASMNAQRWQLSRISGGERNERWSHIAEKNSQHRGLRVWKGLVLAQTEIATF